jgi:two-component system cell cycle sensor histidine kinase/response regulator CckA
MSSSTEREAIKVLLVEDDEDDYFLARELFAEIQNQRFVVEWAKTYEKGLDAIQNRKFDVCLVDYRLGGETGLGLLGAAQQAGCEAPIIILTGQGEHEVDLQAMSAGAADYLVKGRLDSGLLERSIRYAIERKRANSKAASEQARIAAFGQEVGLALTQRGALEGILNRCAKAMVDYLHAALGRIWVYDEEEKKSKLLASAGLPGAREAGPQPSALHNQVLASRQPLLINRVLGDPRVADQEWVKREGIVSCAGYPLVIEDRLVGMMSLFSRSPLSESTLQEMGSVANGIALCVDRKRSAQALDASEFKYRSVVENIKEVIFQINEHGRFGFLNPAWTEMTGFKLKDTLETPLVDYLHPEDRERHWDVFQQLIERRLSSCRQEMRFLAKDGSFRWVEVYAQPIFQNELFGASGSIRDITERKQAEAEIEKLAAFVRLNPDPVVELAADGTLTYLNPAAREFARLLNVDDPAGILPRNVSAIARECLRMGHSKLHEEISVAGRTLSWSFFPIITSQVVHCYGADVTDRINLETQLRHSQKLESIGQLAAGVAHDFNNILTIIQGHSDRLLARHDGDQAITDPLSQVSAAAKRGASLTRQLLMFSRKQMMQLRVVDLNVVLGNMTKMLQRLLGEHIAFESKFGEHLPAIEADIGMIEQVIMNLSVNARDAMPKGGQLLIATEVLEIGEAYVQQNPEARSGRFLVMSVTDTGCGMDRPTLARIFEPFFTTKEVGKGTGLGLATVYGIVKQHQGWIKVTSEPGQGTTFKIYLPASTKPAEVVEVNSPQRQIRGGRETILVVEDEPVLRELARMILKDYQYEVLEAGTGAEALEVWDKHNGKIDLLLTDMVMPEGMTGRELAEQLKHRKPNLKIVFTSGYSSDLIDHDEELADVRFLQKPYPPPQLAQTVRECLDVH